MTKINMITECRDVALLNDSNKAGRGWNHEGFVSRMTNRLEKVRRLIKEKDETTAMPNNNGNVHIM